MAFKWSIAELTFVGIGEETRGRPGKILGERGRGWEGTKTERERGTKHTEVKDTY